MALVGGMLNCRVEVRRDRAERLGRERVRRAGADRREARVRAAVGDLAVAGQELERAQRAEAVLRTRVLSYLDGLTGAVLVRKDQVDYDSDNPKWAVFPASPPPANQRR